MSEVIEGVEAEAPADTTPVEQVESADDRALTMGWVPKEQFRGDPEKWVDADTFIKRGEEFLPFLKANNKRLEQAQERQTKEIGRLKATLEKFSEFHSKSEQRAYERAVRDLQTEQAAAVEANDLGRVQEITKEIVDLTADVKAPAKAAGDPEELVDWKADNAWFGKDAVMRGAAIEIVNELIAAGETNLSKQLTEVTKRIKAEFPHKFENPNRKGPAAVEGVSGAVRRPGKGYADLPADAKQMCDEFVRDIKGFTREKFIKDYAWEQSK